MKLMHARVLSIDPIAKGFAFAVLEGPERLVDQGTVYMPHEAKQISVEQIESVFWRYLPDVIVLEAGRRPRSGKPTRAQKLIRRIEKFASDRGLPVRKVSRSDVQFVFRGSIDKPKPTKQEIAEVIARFFPELAEKLPSPRKFWEVEQERMSVFDAVSFALAVLRSPESTEEILF